MVYWLDQKTPFYDLKSLSSVSKLGKNKEMLEIFDGFYLDFMGMECEFIWEFSYQKDKISLQYAYIWLIFILNYYANYRFTCLWREK